MKQGMIKEIVNVKSEEQLADVFTKKGVKPRSIIVSVCIILLKLSPGNLY